MTSRVKRVLKPTGHTGVVLLMLMPHTGFVAARGGAHDEEGR